MTAAKLIDRDGFVRTRDVDRPYPPELVISQAISGDGVGSVRYKLIGGDYDRRGKRYVVYHEA